MNSRVKNVHAIAACLTGDISEEREGLRFGKDSLAYRRSVLVNDNGWVSLNILGSHTTTETPNNPNDGGPRSSRSKHANREGEEGMRRNK